MCDEGSLVKRLEKCLNEKDDLLDELNEWTECLTELATVEDAFGINAESGLQGKTILDVGTDCIKSLYIALKHKPRKIVGISDALPNRASDIEQQSRLFSATKIRFYDCNFFDETTLEKILTREKIGKGEFNIVIVSKVLHHLRFGDQCVVHERDEKHKCDDSEKDCIYRFEAEEIFEKLLEYGKRVVVYEAFWPHETDDDKVRGRGGYFTVREWESIFDQIPSKFRGELISPKRCSIDKIEKMAEELRKVDIVCFYLEKEPS
jgi:hypothetical protein